MNRRTQDEQSLADFLWDHVAPREQEPSELNFHEEKLERDLHQEQDDRDHYRENQAVPEPRVSDRF